MLAHVLSLTLLITAAAPAAEKSDPMAAARMETMLAAGDKDLILQVFKRHDDNILPFIDQYLEGGLKMIEDGKPETEALKSYRTGIAFAKIADEAFPGCVFTEYAASFASWSPEERLQFRRGQSEFRAGRKAMDDPAKALAHFRRSLRLAEPIRDHWGTAMAHNAIAAAELKLGHLGKAEDAARNAVQVCAQLRLRHDQINALVAWGDAQGANGERGFGAGSYQYAYSLLRSTDDPKFREMVLEKQCAALERGGHNDPAKDLRAKFRAEMEDLKSIEEPALAPAVKTP